MAGFATSTTWNSVSSRSGVASTRTSLTEQFDSGVFDYAHVSVQTAATLSTNCNWCFVYELLMRLFHIGNFCFWVPFLKQLLLRNCAVDFVEICNVDVGRMIIKATKRIFNSDKICHSYSDLNFGVTFWNTMYYTFIQNKMYKHVLRARARAMSLHVRHYWQNECPYDQCWE